MIRYRALFILLLLLLLPQPGWSEVIANRSVALDSVNRHYLLSIFSMKTRTWPDGQPIRVFILPPDQPEHNFFVKQDLRIFPYQLIKVWDRAVFSGSGQSPMIVTSPEDMLDRIANTPGAIGYYMSEISGRKDVKTLHVK